MLQFKMSFNNWSAFYLLLSLAPLCFCFQLPSMISGDCYPDVKQSCDKKESLSKVDVSALNSTTRYFLFTRRNPKNPEMLHLCNGTLPKNTNFKAKKKLIVFIPGFLYGVCQIPIIRDSKDEILKKDDYNVILVDTVREYGYDYKEAFDKLPALAKQVSKVLQNIQDQTGIKNDNVDLVGHSLGAQLAGQISRHFRVHRITGIDPAGIHFTEETPTNLRLDDSDAYLVDILHCNGGKGLPNFSIDYVAGDADFFVNGGTLQHNCRSIAMEAMKDLDLMLAVAVVSAPSVCSHLICLHYYYLSINNENSPFKAWECENYQDFKDGKCDASKPVIMGFEYEKNFTQGEAKKPFPRKYYLTTPDKWPYTKKDHQ